MRAKDVNDNKDFWLMMFEKTNLSQFIKNSFTIGAQGAIMRDDTVDEVDQVIDDNDEELAS
jgi:hypothetical protein